MDKSGILSHGKNGCSISYEEIEEISELAKSHFYFSSAKFWMWKMFQFGYAYGKRAERARRKQVSHE